MLKCRQAVERADDLLAGELSFGQRLALRVHLLICHHCRRYVRQLRLLLDVLRRSDQRASDAEVERVISVLPDNKSPDNKSPDNK